MLICDGCGLGYHYQCLGYKRAPRQDVWMCIECNAVQEKAGDSALRSEYTAGHRTQPQSAHPAGPDQPKLFRTLNYCLNKLPVARCACCPPQASPSCPAGPQPLQRRQLSGPSSCARNALKNAHGGCKCKQLQ